MARDLKLDPTTWDLDMSGGTLHIVEGADELAQRIKIRLKSQFGECAFDTDLGVDYIGLLSRRDPDLRAFAADIRRCVMDADGVTGIAQLEITPDDLTRTATIFLTVNSEYGEVTVEAVV